MGSCCHSNSTAKKVYVTFKTEKRVISPAPASLSSLKSSILEHFAELEHSVFALYTGSELIESDDHLQVFLKSVGSKTISVVQEKEPDMDVSGNPFVIQSENASYMAFITNLNLVMTSSKAIPSSKHACKTDYKLSPGSFYYKSTHFCIVGLLHQVNTDTLQIVSKILKIGDKVLVSNKETEILQIDPTFMNYKGDFVPGSPILHGAEVVGMHIEKNTGLNMQAVISELQQLPRSHHFSDKIDKLLTQVVFLDDIPSPTARFKNLYCLNENGLTCFNTAEQAFSSFEIDICEKSALAQAPTGAFITGGIANAQASAKVTFFDTYSQSVVSKSELITPRFSHAATCSEFGLFVVSGVNESGLTNECEFLEFKKNFWKPIYPINIARSNPAACHHRNGVYVAGGNDKNGQICRVVEHYEENRWKTLEFNVPEGWIRPVAFNDEVLILGTALYRRNQEISETVQGLPGKQVAVYQGKIYVFVSNKEVAYTEGSSWTVVRDV